MKKLILNLIIFFWTVYCLSGILRNFSHYKLWDWIIIILLIILSYKFLWILHQKISSEPNKSKDTNTINKFSTANHSEHNTDTPYHIRQQNSDSAIGCTMTSNNTEKNSADIITSAYIETEHMIHRADGEKISDNEIPYLIEISKKHALEACTQSQNPKFNRTEREEDLCVQFMMNHDNEIEKHTHSFEDHYRLAHTECNLDKKIELLQETIALYEKEKKWFYRTKGGTIYFQDFYEHLHSSKTDNFSYIDSVEEYLKECIKKRDYIIPKIFDLVTSSNGILQKDIYNHLPDIPKADIQKTIRELENTNLITRTKKGNSYFLTLP